MTDILDDIFLPVAQEILNAHLVAYDGCHKIYLAMDEEEAEDFRANYPHVVEGTAEEMLLAVIGWYEKSCGLRFVSAVTTNHEDPNAGYKTLISQFAEDGHEDTESYEDDFAQD